MSDAVDLLIAKLDDLKTQHRAGINPGPDEIAELFELHALAKRHRQAERDADSLAGLPSRWVPPQPAPPSPVCDSACAGDVVTDADVALKRRRGSSRRRKPAA